MSHNEIVVKHGILQRNRLVRFKDLAIIFFVHGNSPYFRACYRNGLFSIVDIPMDGDRFSIFGVEIDFLKHNNVFALQEGSSENKLHIHRTACFYRRKSLLNYNFCATIFDRFTRFLVH